MPGALLPDLALAEASVLLVVKAIRTFDWHDYLFRLDCDLPVKFYALGAHFRPHKLVISRSGKESPSIALAC